MTRSAVTTVFRALVPALLVSGLVLLWVGVTRHDPYKDLAAAIAFATVVWTHGWVKLVEGRMAGR